jgi:hypothetical protein
MENRFGHEIVSAQVSKEWPSVARLLWERWLKGIDVPDNKDPIDFLQGVVKVPFSSYYLWQSNRFSGKLTAFEPYYLVPNDPEQIVGTLKQNAESAFEGLKLVYPYSYKGVLKMLDEGRPVAGGIQILMETFEAMLARGRGYMCSKGSSMARLYRGETDRLQLILPKESSEFDSQRCFMRYPIVLSRPDSGWVGHVTTLLASYADNSDPLQLALKIGQMGHPVVRMISQYDRRLVN